MRPASSGVLVREERPLEAGEAFFEHGEPVSVPADRCAEALPLAGVQWLILPKIR